jgi:hypothetical protein
VLKGILGPKREEVTGGWKNCIMRGFNILYFPQNNIRMIKSKEIGRVCSTHRRDRLYTSY